MLGQHVARPEERARGSRKGSLSSSSGASTDEASCHLARKLLQRRGSEGALRAGDHVLMTPALLGQTVSAESRGVTWRGGQQLERGARETPAKSRLHCSLYPLYDPGQSTFLLLQSLYFSQQFFFAMKTSIFENFEKLIQ